MVVFLLRVLSRFFALMPLPMALSLGSGLGRLFGVAVIRNRRRAMDGLRESLPECPEAERRRIMNRMFAHLGMNVIEMLRWLGGREAELSSRIRLEGEEHVRQALAQGHGVAVLTAHIGNWDLMGLWAASQFPLTIISKVIKHEGLNRFWMEKRAAARVRILPAHNSYRQCLRVLKAGECLGFILDQNMTRDEGIFVDFFGRPACTTPGLAMLAAHAQSPVLPVFMYRESGARHVVRILPPLPPPADRKPETLVAATQDYTHIIERAIRRAPDQWIWMHRRWRTRPLPAAEQPASSMVQSGEQAGSR